MTAARARGRALGEPKSWFLLRLAPPPSGGCYRIEPNDDNGGGACLVEYSAARQWIGRPTR
jgi:hypothetical protein